MSKPLTQGEKARRANSETSRTAVETLIGTAAAGYPDIVLMGIETRPYPRSTALRAVATFTGASDRDTIVDLSDDLSNLIIRGVPGSWTFADRIECDHTASGFRLTVGFETGAGRA